MQAKQHQPLALSHSTTKIPPGWDPGTAQQYSFLQYKKDLQYWLRTTELDEVRIGPAIALRLKGVARRITDRLMSKDSPVHPGNGNTLLTHGDYDINPMGGWTVKPGWRVLFDALREKFDRLSYERAVKFLLDFFTFRVKPGEDIDSIIARFELVRDTGTDEIGLTMSYVCYAFPLLSVSGIPMKGWPHPTDSNRK